MGAPHITKTHDVLADVGCMSLPGTDPVPALRAAQRCGATPILWATGQPIANQLDPLVVWADVPPDGPLPPNVTALIAATERAAAIDPERTDLVRILDREKHDLYTATLDEIHRYCFAVTRGYGSQWALARDDWSINGCFPLASVRITRPR